jgi:hypothetical protein
MQFHDGPLRSTQHHKGYGLEASVDSACFIGGYKHVETGAFGGGERVAIVESIHPWSFAFVIVWPGLAGASYPGCPCASACRFARNHFEISPAVCAAAMTSSINAVLAFA